MSHIFISYRRSDAAAEAGRIYDYLENRLGENSVFKDVDNISAGEDFRQRLNEAMAECQVLLAVIGKSWLQVKDASGQQRLNNPADWVRLEIETALARNVRVIPVLLDGVEMPSSPLLPDALVPLAYRNAARIRHDPDFRRDMDRLIDVIEQHITSATNTSATNTTGSEPWPKTYLKGQSRNGDGRPKIVSQFSQRISQQMSRRQAMKWLGYSGSGLGLALLGQSAWQSLSQISSDAHSGNLLRPGTLTQRNFKPVSFDIVTANSDGEIISTENKQSYVFEQKIKGVVLQLLPIPTGRFLMGMPSDPEFNGETRADRPQREVSIAPFLMGRYSVTQAQWKAVAALPMVNRELSNLPFQFQGDELPAEEIDWEEATEFCLRLSRHSGRTYRLPSEAEWEYACRAGTTTYFHVGDKLTSELANYDATGGKAFSVAGIDREQTTPVGSFPANGFGLHDMHGNVAEWCLDPWHPNYEGAPSDGSPWLEDGDPSLRVIRGGSWKNPAFVCSSAKRDRITKTNGLEVTGFRVVCETPWRL